MPVGISTSLTSTIETLIAPGRRRLVDDLLQDRVDLVALGQELVERVLAEDAPQRRLRDLRRRDHEVLDLHDRLLGVDDPEVGDRVHADRDVVLRDHLLRRDVQRHRPQVDADHLVDDRDQQEEARALRRRLQPAEPEDDAPLVLARHADRTRRGRSTGRPRLLRLRSGRPSERESYVTRDRLLGRFDSRGRGRRRSGRPEPAPRLESARRCERACQSSPRTKTRPDRSERLADDADLADQLARSRSRPARCRAWTILIATNAISPASVRGDRDHDGQRDLVRVAGGLEEQQRADHKADCLPRA